MAYTGVVDTSSGNLLRYGINVDFENDGAFDSENETYKETLPDRPKRSGEPFQTMMSNWDGESWGEVAQP